MEVGIIANPASGKDIRRLTARASVFDNQEKAAIVRRCLAGLLATADPAIRYLADSHRITESALSDLGIKASPLEVDPQASSIDSQRAASALRGVDVVISLGGDGTNRAIAKGWLEAPLIAISTGTNNAYPAMLEATVAGIAAGLVASKAVDLDSVSSPSKIAHVEIEGDNEDLALIDIVGTSDRFVGSRAIVDPSAFSFAVVTVANPCNVGVSGIAGCVRCVEAKCDAALCLTFADDKTDRPFRRIAAPIAPGIVDTVNVSSVKTLRLGERVEFAGPFTMALDGERERFIAEGQQVAVEVRRDGPRLIDVDAAVTLGAQAEAFYREVGMVQGE